MKPPLPSDESPFRDHFPEEVLEDLEDLPNYNDWITSQFAPFLGGRTAEIGAGLGTISGRLLSRVQNLDLIEPAPVMAAQLAEKFDGNKGVRVFEQTLEAWQQGATAMNTMESFLSTFLNTSKMITPPPGVFSKA